MTGTEDYIEPDDAESVESLISEVQKVRTALRGTLVPTTQLLRKGDKPNELLQAPMIWMLATGTKQEHLSFASVAAALQRTGYRVKVFGAGSWAHIFTRLGIAFEAHDTPVLLHRNNRKGRLWLQTASSEFGFEGPDKELDFLLDLYLLRHEFGVGLSVKTALEGNPGGFGVVAVLTERKFNDLFMRSDCTPEFTSYIRQRYSEVLAWRAKERRMSIENFEPVRKARSRAFRDFLRQKGKDLGFDAIDIAEAMRFELAKRLVPLMAKAAQEGKDVAPVVMGEIQDYQAWLAGQSPREWWERWTKKLPAWRDVLPNVRCSQGMVPNAMHNMLFTLESLETSDKPQLLLYKVEMAPIALMLEAKFNIGSGLLWPYMMPLRNTDHFAFYCLVAAEEKKERIPFTPVTDMGPLAFAELLSGMRQVCGTSSMRLKDEMVPVELRSCPVLLHKVRQLVTGPWHLDAHPAFLEPDDAILFGSEGERELTCSFLADSSDPPIYFGWGKRMHPKGPYVLAMLVAQTLKNLGRRGVFMVGSSGATLDHVKDVCKKKAEESLSEDEAAAFKDLADYAQRRILFIRGAPHNWLFPKCACVVHHGGPGTTHAGLNAGVPQAILRPMKPPPKSPASMGDLLRLQGCGKECTCLDETNPADLTAALRHLLEEPKVKAKAADVAKTIQKQPGVLGVVPLVSHMFFPTTEDVPHADQATPWQNGVWGWFRSGSRLNRLVVKGGKWCDPVDGHQVGWVRYGSYRQEDMRGLPAGHSIYTVQGFWPEATMVSYGVVSNDGKKITWDNDNLHLWESDFRDKDEEPSLLPALRSPGLQGSLLSCFGCQQGQAVSYK